MKAVNVDDVLKILYKYGRYIFVTDEKRYSSMVDEIANLKALEQEPKTGHWIKIVVNRQHKIKCDKCDYTEAEYITHIRNYCPNCGTRMEEEDE